MCRLGLRVFQGAGSMKDPSGLVPGGSAHSLIVRSVNGKRFQESFVRCKVHKISSATTSQQRAPVPCHEQTSLDHRFSLKLHNITGQGSLQVWIVPMWTFADDVDRDDVLCEAAYANPLSCRVLLTTREPRTRSLAYNLTSKCPVRFFSQLPGPG